MGSQIQHLMDIVRSAGQDSAPLSCGAIQQFLISYSGSGQVPGPGDHGGGQGGTVNVESGRATSFQHLRVGALAADEVGSGSDRKGQASTWVSSASRI